MSTSTSVTTSEKYPTEQTSSEPNPLFETLVYTAFLPTKEEFTYYKKPTRRIYTVLHSSSLTYLFTNHLISKSTSYKIVREGLSYDPSIAKLNHIVIAKIKLIDSESITTAFKEERAIRKLNGLPGIARFLFLYGYSSGSVKKFAIGMQRYPLDLQQYFSRGPRLTKEDLFRFVLDLKDSLVNMKKQTIVHCDIKTDNILVEFVDGKPCLRIFDLGLSVDMENKLENDCFISTECMMAPEQKENNLEKQGYPIDMWAMGLIYEKLVKYYNLTHEESPIDTLDPIIEQMLDPDPDKRITPEALDLSLNTVLTLLV